VAPAREACEAGYPLVTTRLNCIAPVPWPHVTRAAQYISRSLVLGERCTRKEAASLLFFVHITSSGVPTPSVISHTAFGSARLTIHPPSFLRTRFGSFLCLTPTFPYHVAIFFLLHSVNASSFHVLYVQSCASHIIHWYSSRCRETPSKKKLYMKHPKQRHLLPHSLPVASLSTIISQVINGSRG
jgi:hypothetical protein